MDTGKVNNKFVILGLAWLSWIAALIGGWGLNGTWGGSFIAGVLGFLPDPVAPIILFLGGLWMLLDAFLDFEPNRPAVWLAIFLPSVGQAVNGSWGRQFHQWGAELNSKMTSWMGEALGTSSLFALAAIFIGAALILARRVVKKNRAAKDQARGGAPAMAR
jgi:hypothetical protein